MGNLIFIDRNIRRKIYWEYLYDDRIYLWRALHRNFPLHTDLSYKAAKHGHLDRLKWLNSQKVLLDIFTCAEAAKHGDIEILEWLKEIKCRFDVNSSIYAACNGRTRVLEWLETNEYPVLKYQMTRYAAICGQLETLRWMVERGYSEIAPIYTIEIARKGHLDVLKYLHEIGAPICRSACVTAAKENSHHYMVLWLENEYKSPNSDDFVPSDDESD